MLVRYFRLLAENFPKHDNQFTRKLNFGEFVHFWGGAANANLKDLAESAFGWSEEREAEFEAAQAEFPNVTY